MVYFETFHITVDCSLRCVLSISTHTFLDCWVAS